MTYAVRVTDDYVGLMGRYVVEGQMIVPGLPLLDIMTPEGVVETIHSEGWGIVAHVEGHRVFRAIDDTELVDEDYDAQENGDDEDEDEDGEGGETRSSGGGSSAVYAKGDLICQIIPRGDFNSIKGGRPHPSTSRSISNAKAAGALLPTYG